MLSPASEVWPRNLTLTNSPQNHARAVIQGECTNSSDTLARSAIVQTHLLLFRHGRAGWFDSAQRSVRVLVRCGGSCRVGQGPGWFHGRGRLVWAAFADRSPRLCPRTRRNDEELRSTAKLARPSVLSPLEPRTSSNAKKRRVEITNPLFCHPSSLGRYATRN